MSELTTVTVLTVDGDEHKFPSMSKKELRAIIAATGSTLTLVNAGGACLTMPLRSVQSIVSLEEVLWKRPSPTDSSAA